MIPAATAPRWNDASMPKTYHLTRTMKAMTPTLNWMARSGMMGGAEVLTVRGRTTGEPRSTPVTPLEHDGTLWLVSPYGIVAWVRNLRASGEATLTRRGTTRRFSAREASPEEAGPVLKRYVTAVSIVRPYFAAVPDDPTEAFVAEAAGHPVFALTEIR